VRLSEHEWDQWLRDLHAAICLLKILQDGQNDARNRQRSGIKGVHESIFPGDRIPVPRVQPAALIICTIRAACKFSVSIS
jgi:hypothetical protein